MGFFGIFGGTQDVIEIAPPPMESPQPVVDDADDGGIILFLSKILILLGGVLPYIPQYFQIAQTQDASGFSTFVCLVVISSSLLRIAYWFGHWFDNVLLYQSIIMTLMMFLLLELCLRVNRARALKDGQNPEESTFHEFDLERFWQWTNLLSYMEASILLFSVAVFYTTAFRGNDLLVEPVGFAALMIESTLGLPQVIKNYQNESTEGMNIFMVILWTIGDAGKAFFFFHTGQPIPFRLCAVIQLFFDFVLFCQVGYYSDQKKPSVDQSSSDKKD